MASPTRIPHIVIRSDKDTHFTGALAQNAGEDEDLAHPSYAGFPTAGHAKKPDAIASSRIFIRELRVWSDQNLSWEVQFYSKDTFDDTDADVDTFLGSFTFAVADGLQVAGAGLYRYNQTKLELFYYDADKTGEIHMKLVNRSTTSKNAGATGEVVVEIAAEPLA